MVAVIAPYSRCKRAVKYVTLRICAVEEQTQWHLIERRAISVQAPTTTTVRARGAPLALYEMLLRCYGDLTVTSLRSYQNAERLRYFVHAQSARRHSAFYAVPSRLLAMPLRCRGDDCGRNARTSAFCIFYWTLWDCRENAALVWQWYFEVTN